MPSTVWVPATPSGKKTGGGGGRPPIKEQEAIEALNPLLNKEKKSIEELKQEH